MSYIEIIIARYKEDLSWLKKINKNIKVTVYNKGPGDINIPFIKLPNIGRESHTYLYHIINNYNNLADITIFAQGDPFFHSPNFLELINSYNDFELVQPLSSYYSNIDNEYTPPISLLNRTENLWLNGYRIHVEYLDNNFVTVYPLNYYNSMTSYVMKTFKKIYNIDNILKFNKERFLLDDVNTNYLIPVCYAALFAINKNVILDHCRDFYNNIMSLLIWDIRYSFNKAFDLGFILERLWLVIFNYKKYNKNYLSLKVKDYKSKNIKLKLTNNKAHFEVYIFNCYLYFELMIDKICYMLTITKTNISLKKNKQKLIIIDNTIDDEQLLNIQIILIKNNLKLYINNKNILDYIINCKKINNIILFDIYKNNLFINKH